MATEIKLQFLPLFYKDLEDTVDYISLVLMDPDAADRLVDDILAAIYKRLLYNKRNWQDMILAEE